MKLGEYLNSGLLPRIRRSPDVFSKESYLGLPHFLSVYGDDGFKIADHLNDMDVVKYETIEKYFDCDVVQVQLSVDSDTAFLTIIISIPRPKDGAEGE